MQKNGEPREGVHLENKVVRSGDFRAELWQRLRKRSEGLNPSADYFGEVFEIVQVMSADLKDDVPLDELVAVDSDVSEPDRFRHAFSERGAEDLQVLENCEILRHGRGRSGIGVGNHMGGEVDAKLDGPL